MITAQMQAMSDALAPGNAVVWDKYLDDNVIYADENGRHIGKAEILKETQPLPKGLGGSIKVDLLSYNQDGDVAVALFRQNETENYYAQVLHASYLTNTTWKKRAAGWRMIGAQVLAEKADPPAIALPGRQLMEYVGTYRLAGSDPTWTITLADGKLVGTRSGRKPAVWDAEASDVFFVKGDPRIRKIFRRDARGRVSGFVERRESWDLIWTKTR